jgi:T5orf172 domain
MQGRDSEGSAATTHGLDVLLEMEPSEMSEDQLRSYIGRLQRLRKKDIRQILKDESHGRPEYDGFIYVLSNSAMPGLLKIGFTVGRVEKRVAELNSASGVPECFKIEKVFPVYANARQIERKIHSALGIFRSTRNREFFRISVEYTIAVINALLGKTP